MANNNPRKKPHTNREGRDKANRIAAISHRIAEIGPHFKTAITGLTDQLGTLIDQIKADCKATEAREHINQDRSTFWMRWGTISSIVLSSFSLFISGVALYILNKQLNSMQIEQRAWIQVEHAFEPITENEPFFATMTIKNIGKTPAKRVQALYMVQKVRKADSPDLKDRAGVQNFAGIINPDVAIPIKVPLFRDGDEVNLLKPPRLTKAEIDEIATGETYGVAFGRITYLDVYGTSHWINFCFWQSMMAGTYSSRKCVEYNDVDDN